MTEQEWTDLQSLAPAIANGIWTAGPCFHNADTWEVIDQEGRRIASTSGVRRREVGPFLAAAPALYCYAERLRAENATLVAEVERLREALTAITARKWDSMTDGCNAAVEAKDIARTALKGSSQ